MNNAEKALVRDVLGWYRKELGLPSPGLTRGQLRFIPPDQDAALFEDADSGIRLSASKWKRAATYACLAGLLVAFVIFAWAGWFHIGVFLFTSFCIALLYFLPILLALVPDRVIRIEYGPRAEQELVRALALAYLNHHPVREAAHCLLDALLAPLLLSWQEGMAYWFTREYYRTTGRTGFSKEAASMRGRITADLLWLPARLGGRRLMCGLLRYL